MVSAMLSYRNFPARSAASSVENPFSLLPHITEANRSPVPEKLTSKKCDLWVVVPFAVVTRLYIKGALSSLAFDAGDDYILIFAGQASQLLAYLCRKRQEHILSRVAVNLFDIIVCQKACLGQIWCDDIGLPGKSFMPSKRAAEYMP